MVRAVKYTLDFLGGIRGRKLEDNDVGDGSRHDDCLTRDVGGRRRGYKELRGQG